MIGKSLYYSTRACVMGLIVAGYAISIFQFSGIA
jgi:hypothetical protein